MSKSICPQIPHTLLSKGLNFRWASIEKYGQKNEPSKSESWGVFRKDDHLLMNPRPSSCYIPLSSSKPARVYFVLKWSLRIKVVRPLQWDGGGNWGKFVANRGDG